MDGQSGQSPALLMLARYPSSALLRELASYLKRTTIKALVGWTLRTTNKEAGALANCDVSKFLLEMMTHVKPHLRRYLRHRSGVRTRSLRYTMHRLMERFQIELIDRRGAITEQHAGNVELTPHPKSLATGEGSVDGLGVFRRYCFLMFFPVTVTVTLTVSLTLSPPLSLFLTLSLSYLLSYSLSYS